MGVTMERTEKKGIVEKREWLKILKVSGPRTGQEPVRIKRWDDEGGQHRHFVITFARSMEHILCIYKNPDAFQLFIYTKTMT